MFPEVFDDPMGEIVVVRHGETEWSRSGQHTSVTDLPLLPDGEDQARALGASLSGRRFVDVWVPKHVEPESQSHNADKPKDKQQSEIDKKDKKKN